MRLMVGTLRLEPGPGVPFPPLDIFKQVGDLTFEQLAALRHRGAFSTVSLTFTTCCQLTQRLKAVYTDISGSDNMLREWYKVGLSEPKSNFPILTYSGISPLHRHPSFDNPSVSRHSLARRRYPDGQRRVSLF